MIDTEEKISRAGFFRILAQFLLIPAGILSWFSVTGGKKTYGAPGKISLSSVKKGFYYSDDLLISNNSQLKIFSPKCTHLGCRIQNVTGGNAVCPCHGSKFNEDGFPVSGPASAPLKELQYALNKESGELTVYENR